MWTRILTLETGISANFDVRRNVVPPWRVRQAHSGSNSSMTSQNVNAKQTRKVAKVRFDIFCTFFDKNEKNNQSPHWGRDSGIPSSCPRFATSTTRQASSWIANLGHSDGIPSSLQAESWMLQILDTRMGFPRPSLNVVLDSINLCWEDYKLFCILTIFKCLIILYCIDKDKQYITSITITQYIIMSLTSKLIYIF